MLSFLYSMLALSLLAIAGILVVFTRQQRALNERIAALEAERRWYQDALRIAGAGVWQCNLRENRWKWIEDEFVVRGSGRSYHIATNHEFHDRVHPEDRERVMAMEKECLSGRQSLVNDYRYRLENGEERWLRDIGHVIPGINPMLVGVTLDITEDKLATLAETQRLHRDELTDLPNRRALSEVLQARLTEGRASCVGFIDLNGFKQINDLLGHAAGDRCLRAIGRTIADKIAAGEFAARIGGDEFIIIVDATSEGEDVERLRSLVFSALNSANASVAKGRIGAAVGIARMPEDAKTADELLLVADRAMYDAKATKKRVAFRQASQTATLPSARSA